MGWWEILHHWKIFRWTMNVPAGHFSDTLSRRLAWLITVTALDLLPVSLSNIDLACLSWSPFNLTTNPTLSSSPISLLNWLPKWKLSKLVAKWFPGIDYAKIWLVRTCNVHTLKEIRCELHTDHHRKKDGIGIFLSYEWPLNTLSLPFGRITKHTVASVCHALLYIPALITDACLITWRDTLGRLFLTPPLLVEHFLFLSPHLSPALALLEPALWTFIQQSSRKITQTNKRRRDNK